MRYCGQRAAPVAAAAAHRGTPVCTAANGHGLVSNYPVVAIVGRPNVGKSALFNRLVGKRIAIVEPTPGATRDRLYAPLEWNGRAMTLVDTGGIETGKVEDVRAQTRLQAQTAIEEADVILFVVDSREGPMPGDADVAQLLRPIRDKVIVAANKVESPKTANSIYEFCALGFDVPLAVSAVHGLQSGDLLDAIVAKLPPDRPERARDEEMLHLAIVGQPNVGKSTLFNLLAGQKRAIVSELPGTTRDAIDTTLTHDGRRIVMIDTAGVRRHANQHQATEYFSALRAVHALGRCDVALLLVDAVAGVTSQDRRIAGLAVEEGKALAIALNKWDLIDETVADREGIERRLQAEFAFARYAPILYVSALTRKGVRKIWPTVFRVSDERRKRVPTGKLNQVIRDAMRVRPPAAFRGRELTCHYVTQSDVAPPEFVFFVNDPRLVHFSYERYLERAIREAFGFDGTPMRFVFRKRVRQDSTKAEDVIVAAAGDEDA
jgi:GTPase